MERKIARRRYEPFAEGSSSSGSFQEDLPVSSPSQGDNFFWDDDDQLASRKNEADLPDKNPYAAGLHEEYNNRGTANVKSYGFGLEKSAADAYAAKAYSSSGQVAIDMIEGKKGHGYGGFDYRTKKQNKKVCISAGTCCILLILGPIIGGIVAAVAYPKEAADTAAAALRDAESMYQDLSGIWWSNETSTDGEVAIGLSNDTTVPYMTNSSALHNITTNGNATSGNALAHAGPSAANSSDLTVENSADGDPWADDYGDGDFDAEAPTGDNSSPDVAYHSAVMPAPPNSAFGDGDSSGPSDVYKGVPPPQNPVNNPAVGDGDSSDSSDVYDGAPPPPNSVNNSVIGNGDSSDSSDVYEGAPPPPLSNSDGDSSDSSDVVNASPPSPAPSVALDCDSSSCKRIPGAAQDSSDSAEGVVGKVKPKENDSSDSAEGTEIGEDPPIVNLDTVAAPPVPVVAASDDDDGDVEAGNRITSPPSPSSGEDAQGGRSKRDGDVDDDDDGYGGQEDNAMLEGNDHNNNNQRGNAMTVEDETFGPESIPANAGGAVLAADERSDDDDDDGDDEGRDNQEGDIQNSGQAVEAEDDGNDEDDDGNDDGIPDDYEEPELAAEAVDNGTDEVDDGDDGIEGDDDEHDQAAVIADAVNDQGDNGDDDAINEDNDEKLDQAAEAADDLNAEDDDGDNGDINEDDDKETDQAAEAADDVDAEDDDGDDGSNDDAEDDDADQATEAADDVDAEDDDGSNDDADDDVAADADQEPEIGDVFDSIQNDDDGGDDGLEEDDGFAGNADADVDEDDGTSTNMTGNNPVASGTQEGIVVDDENNE